jgi:predicted transcriptional regulator
LKNKEDLFLHSKPAKIMVQLNNPTKENYASKIAKNVDCTYSHAVRTIQKLEEQELIVSNKNGRKKELRLTEEGGEIAETLSELLYQLR